MTIRFLEHLLRALEDPTPFAVAVITGVDGSSPQKKGAKAIFFADGRIYGTLGGGCLEAEIQDRARRALRSQTPAFFELVLDHDFGWDDGLICGGRVKGVILPGAAEAEPVWRELIQSAGSVSWGIRNDFAVSLANCPEGDWLYQETILPPCHLWVAGSGHIAQAVAPFARELEFEVTVFDDRPSLANRRYFPEGTRICVGAWENLLEEPMPERPVFGLIVTRGHQHDALVLRNWLQRPFVFLGMIGSKRKRRLIYDQFQEEGWATAEQLAQIACPVGLDIGAVSVPEIALSILAQLVERRARHLIPKS